MDYFNHGSYPLFFPPIHVAENLDACSDLGPIPAIHDPNVQSFETSANLLDMSFQCPDSIVDPWFNNPASDFYR